MTVRTLSTFEIRFRCDHAILVINRIYQNGMKKQSISVNVFSDHEVDMTVNRQCEATDEGYAKGAHCVEANTREI